MRSARRPFAPALVATTIAAVLVSLVPGLGSATAATAGTGPLTISVQDQYLKYGCADYPIRYDVGASTDWSLDLEIKQPSGEPTWSDFEVGAGSASGVLNAFLCDSLDGAGWYEVTATLTVYDEYYSEVGVYPVTTSFTLARSRSKTRLTFSKKVVHPGDDLVVRGRVTARNGPYAGRPAGDELVLLQVKQKRRWISDRHYTDRRGRLRLRFRDVDPAKAVTRFRLKFPGNDVLDASTSKVLKLRARR